MKLFEIEPKKIEPESKFRCRGCEHIIEHEYNKSFKYCAIQKSNVTLNGLKKIKANSVGCKRHTKN